MRSAKKTVKKALGVRTHVCPHCGYVAARDVNAVLNIWGDLPSSSVGENLLGYGES